MNDTLGGIPAEINPFIPPYAYIPSSFELINYPLHIPYFNQSKKNEKSFQSNIIIRKFLPHNWTVNRLELGIIITASLSE
jgi:hypothetical protein